jgi:hypothetical protein
MNEDVVVVDDAARSWGPAPKIRIPSSRKGRFMR